jgi:iron complex transport system substrate-binding protein
MRSRIDTVVATVSGQGTPGVYYELWYEPLMSCGPDTFIDEAISLAGGVNIFNDATTSWPVVSAEAVIDKNPDVIIFGEVYMSGDYGQTKESIIGRSGWSIITAVANDALYDINDDIINRNGPRVVEAIEAIAAMVHPDLFG